MMMLATLLHTRKKILGLGISVFEVVELATAERLHTTCQQLTSLRSFRGYSAVQSSTASATEGFSACSHALKPTICELGLQHGPRLLHSQPSPLQQSRMLLASCQHVSPPLIPHIIDFLHQRCYGAYMKDLLIALSDGLNCPRGIDAPTLTGTALGSFQTRPVIALLHLKLKSVSQSSQSNFDAAPCRKDQWPPQHDQPAPAVGAAGRPTCGKSRTPDPGSRGRT